MEKRKSTHWFRSETLTAITFKTLSWRNFLSNDNYKTTLDLTRHNNTLVSGENGAGKSTMLDALTFALFGKSFRGITLPQLANSINEKDCEVEIEFSVEFNGIVLSEASVLRSLDIQRWSSDTTKQSLKIIKSILKIKLLKCLQSFCQVVILGSSLCSIHATLYLRQTICCGKPVGH